MKNTYRPLPELLSFVENLPEPRILVDLQYRIVAANRAYREQFSPAQAVVGRHCYEVSHHYTVPCGEAGESCPRAQALGSGHTEHVLHLHHTPRGVEHVYVELTPVRDGSDKMAYFVERMERLPKARGSTTGDELAGRSVAFRDMLELVARVAPTETSVLLLGETGTGKEVVAHAIHAASRRASGPFVVLDCSGLTETLFESELFGYERGAFTGAAQRKTGLVEAASGGTLFLDELGDIPLNQQVKLLRLIETGTYRRVGGIEPLRTDIRLIAATHRDLQELVRREAFRSDLYYRISAFPIRLPALRERREDIPLLAASLLARVAPGHGQRLSTEAVAALCAHDYPGNIRELRNILERASLLADGELIETEHLPPRTAPPESAGHARAPATLRHLADTHLRKMLETHRGDRKSLAAALGISERTLYRRLKALNRPDA